MKKLKISKKSFETVFTFNLAPQKAVEIIIPTPPDTPPPVPPPEPIYPPFPPLIPFPPTVGTPFNSPSYPPFDPIPPVEEPYYQPKLWRKLYLRHARSYAWKFSANYDLLYNQQAKDHYEGFKASQPPGSAVTAAFPDDWGESITELGWYPVNEYTQQGYEENPIVIIWDAYWTRQAVNYAGLGEEINDFLAGSGAAGWAPFVIKGTAWGTYWGEESYMG